MLRRIARRDFLKTSAGVLAGASLGLPRAASAKAEGYPARPLSVLNPANAGGGWDLMTRIISPGLEKALGQPIRQEFLPGASGQVAFRRLVNATPDGHTLAISTVNLVSLMLEFRKPQGLTADDLAFVGSIVVEPDVLFVRKDAHWSSIADFIDEARKRPLRVSAVGPLNTSHVAAVVLKELSGANLNIVMYPGGSPARNAVVNGEVDATVAALYSASPVYGSVKGIGVLWDRNPLPEVFTMPAANSVLDFKMPHLLEPSAFYVQTRFREQDPAAFEKLVAAYKTAFSDPITRQMAEKVHYPTQSLQYMEPEALRAFVRDYVELTRRFANLLQPS